MALAQPQFIDTTDANTLLAQIQSDYEAATGKTLEPGQAENFILNAMAYRESLIRLQIQYAGEQGLIDFARAPILDYLGALIGVTRLADKPDTVNALYTLVSGHTGVTVPAGHRVSTTDGKYVFQTMQETIIDIGVDTVTIELEAQVTGSLGYGIGTVSVILDPLAFLQSVSNTNVSGGGSAVETDDALRERIKLAPGSFSNAGSSDAYKFWAKTANATIIDVEVTSPTPGTVNVYPLVSGGITTPSQVITDVENALSAETVRPLCDTVVVLSPDIQDYDITVGVYLYNPADQTETIALIETSLQNYSNSIMTGLGLNVVIDQIKAATLYPIKNPDGSFSPAGVYSATVTLPVADIDIDETTVGVVGTITVNFLGFVAG